MSQSLAPLRELVPDHVRICWNDKKFKAAATVRDRDEDKPGRPKKSVKFTSDSGEVLTFKNAEQASDWGTMHSESVRKYCRNKHHDKERGGRWEWVE